MGTPKHGRCRRGIRPTLGSIGRPQAGLNGERPVFWQAIAQGHSTERSAEIAGVSAAVETRWFRQGGGMPDISLKKAPTDRYLTLAEREEIALLKAIRAMASARLRAALAVRHPRYPGSCGATLPLAVDTSSIAPSPLSGMPIAAPSAPRKRSSRPMPPCVSMSRTVWLRHSRPRRAAVRGHKEAGREGDTDPVKIDTGPAPGVRNRYRIGCVWISRRIQP